MIAKHSYEQSGNGEGVAVIKNESCEHTVHGNGQYTEKRIYLSSRLPSWIAAIVPNIFYITEKAWNYYPHTITVLIPKLARMAISYVCVTGLLGLWVLLALVRNSTDSMESDRLVVASLITAAFLRQPNIISAFCCVCFHCGLENSGFSGYLENRIHLTLLFKCSFLPKFAVNIQTRYEDNNGCSENCLDLNATDLEQREVDHVDIVLDEFPEKYYKQEEDPSKFVSQKCGRGPLKDDWKETCKPLMCSYKLTRVQFEVWGLQSRVEAYCHKAIRDVLLVGHRQAFTWMDEWHGVTMDDIRDYERHMQEETNEKLGIDNFKEQSGSSSPTTPTNTPTETRAPVSF